MDWARSARLSVLALGFAGAGVAVHAQEAQGPALADAAEMGDAGLVSALLHEGADPNTAQVDGMTALHWAVYHDDADIAGLLVRSGAAVNAKNRYEVPPLSLAATNGNATVVDVLLGAGADPNASLLSGETVLMIAARTGSVEAVERLLAAGADPNATEWRDQTALMWAAAEGHTSVVEALIDAGADLHAKLKSGFKPIFFAVREGHGDVVRALLDGGADVNEVLQRVREGPDPTVNNASYRPVDRGISPLLMAVRNGHFELAVELIEAGADPSDQRSGFTPLHTMSWVRKPDESDRGDPAPVGSGSLSGLEFVRVLVDLGADINLRLDEGGPRQPNSASRISSGGATPFLLAADRADAALMRHLIELGADPFLPNLKGTTPLMAAAGLGTTAPEEEAGTGPEALIATQLLLELGADVNAVNIEDDTAMHGAAYGMFPDIVDLLAESGADPHIWKRENHRGWSPLFISEGYRFGLPRPSQAVRQKVERLMVAAGIPTEGPRPEIIDIYEIR